MAQESSKPTSETQNLTLVVEEQEFAVFGQWMDSQLEVLVARWIHTAAPSATKFARVQAQFGRNASK